MRIIGNNSMGSSTRRISNKGFVGMLKEQKARLYIIRRCVGGSGTHKGKVVY
ncbi:hypothetical protein Hanom_Chr08g00726041 [Helianthus anomalus]